MKQLLAATALAALIAAPGFAQSAPGDNRAAAKKKNKAIAAQMQPRRASPYSTNPEYDVYFRGEYVGSDPDPRVRWTLRNEARRSYGLDN